MDISIPMYLKRNMYLIEIDIITGCQRHKITPLSQDRIASTREPSKASEKYSLRQNLAF
jgi:hypothetical protein